MLPTETLCPLLFSSLIGRSRSSAFRLSAGNSSSTTSITLEQASEQIVGSKNTDLALSLETEYLAIGEQGGCTTVWINTIKVVATPIDPRTQSVLPSLWALCWRRWTHFRMIEPPDVSKINRPIPFPPSAPCAISAQSTTRPEPQDRTKAAKVSEHRRRAPIQFMLTLHCAGVDHYNFG